MAASRKSERPPVIYLASPYTHSEKAIREERFRAVCYEAGKMIMDGAIVFSPIIHCHEISNTRDIDTGFSAWEEYDKRVIDVCDQLWVLMLEGWERSEGVRKEIEYAEEIGIPIVKLNPERNTDATHEKEWNVCSQAGYSATDIHSKSKACSPRHVRD